MAEETIEKQCENKPRRRGHPGVPPEKRRDRTLTLYLTEAEQRAIRQTCGLTNVSVWLRNVALRACSNSETSAQGGVLSATADEEREG